ncbi:MAG TPA: VWA domain-containing protein [Thermoguttaceae bacterium]|nr:VWA domain-containing protein [Thermoguttaceae bacterium]
MNADHRDSNTSELNEARLTAYALSQLHETEQAAVEAQLAGLDEATGRRVRRTVEEIRALAGHVREGSRQDPGPEPSPGLRAAVERRLGQSADSPAAARANAATAWRRQRAQRRWIALAVAVCILIAAAPLYLLVDVSIDPRTEREVALAERQRALEEPAGLTSAVTSRELKDSAEPGRKRPPLETTKVTGEELAQAVVVEDEVVEVPLPEAVIVGAETHQVRNGQQIAEGGVAAGGQPGTGAGAYGMGGMGGPASPAPAGMGMPGMPGLVGQPGEAPSGAGMPGMGPGMGSGSSPEQGPSYGGYPGTGGAGYGMPGGEGMMGGMAGGMYGGAPYSPGNQSMGYGYDEMSRHPELPKAREVAGQPGGANVAFGGGSAKLVTDGMGSGMDRRPMSGGAEHAQVRVLAEALRAKRERLSDYATMATGSGAAEKDPAVTRLRVEVERLEEDLDVLVKRGRRLAAALRFAPGSEQYAPIVENEFLPAASRPLSTFSIDVDTASYANVRRFLNEGRWPPPDAVRIEEMVNYFRYDYGPPEDGSPFSVHTEVAQCPWQGEHRLLRIGLKGQEIEREARGPSNLVFLLDVSGSMADQNKLPLLKQAMRLLVEQLTEDDRVAIVTYASSAGLRLESTCASDRRKILDAIDALSAGGSTHGSAGIQLAYEQAGQHFVEGGTNRVILATDGDLNVGITDHDELVKLIRKKARSGVFLTVLGFGTGNLKDSKLEKLADHGNGLYAYLDNLREARKVLIEQIAGSLVTIAKDVKIQIEFNPGEVESYRLIGYENRLLAARDFDDDKKDAGEIGAGHTVTALYELVPAEGRPGGGDAGDDGPMLKYQRPAPRPVGELTEAAASGELLTLRLRYKEPDGKRSKLLEFVAGDSDQRFGQASPDFQFAAAVASFGMVLRGSQYAGDVTLAAVEEFAVSGMGNDPGGYRAEFVDLVRRAGQLPERGR